MMMLQTVWTLSEGWMAAFGWLCTLLLFALLLWLLPDIWQDIRSNRARRRWRNKRGASHRKTLYQPGETTRKLR